MEPKEEFDKYQAARWKFFVSVFLSIACGVLALTGLLKPSTEELGVWFQRSGSLIVLFAVLGEYYVSKMASTLRPAGHVGITKMEETLPKTVGLFHLIALFLAIIGTFIWGYGDLWV
ncbi:hypothetical protein [Alteromonas gracilis]|uniref:hypothetical protein n=1 Tax=Alteromonas gracilis TaxID=1479524 RepID=UPI0037363285